MTYQDITVAIESRVLTITLSRPDRLNAWTHRMETEFRQAVEAAEADEAVRAIVVTGAGRGFCAGADMDILEAGAAGAADATIPPPAAPPAASGIEANYAWRFSYLLRVRKPIFAAINGPIAGIGLCMAVFCDFRYMAEGQKLTTAFAKRGLIAEHGISWMLPRLLGPTHALDLLLSARTLVTAEAASLGLVKALPAEGFLAAVQALARDMTDNASPRSIGVIKRQVYDSLFQDLDTAWRRADEEMQASFASEDFREGVAHFLEKRAPAFTGR
ncbi:enoyl-CoA hydratase [Variovorax sp. J22R24]|uniref:enoyl-CoA hydratase n=1 Tax=Variovorax gracilis TaxID=3053502 RepID=UPI002576F4D9|nr:enoyl-CoA hydratase [Variovorax sp. J22R24]MDM0110327.1 enoyl-CoA hydratase [Variovorax sp. J22R24]